MGRMQYIKESKLEKILNDKYDGNILKLQQAENDLELLNNLNTIGDSLEKSNGIMSNEHKYFCFDLLNNEISTTTGNIIIGMSIDQLYTREYINKTPSAVLSNFNIINNKNETKIQKIYNFIISSLKNKKITSFNYNKINDGKIDIVSTHFDSIFGNSKQYFHAEINENIYNSINKKNIIEAKELLDNKKIIDFYTFIGLNKFFIRCDCKPFDTYYRTNNKNLLCSHCMNMLNVIPYYFYYNLGRC
jgi:hypothetical protein